MNVANTKQITQICWPVVCNYEFFEIHFFSVQICAVAEGAFTLWVGDIVSPELLDFCCWRVVGVTSKMEADYRGRFC